jgi:hypothetical protein
MCPLTLLCLNIYSNQTHVISIPQENATPC